MACETGCYCKSLCTVQIVLQIITLLFLVYVFISAMKLRKQIQEQIQDMFDPRYYRSRIRQSIFWEPMSEPSENS